MVYKMADCDEAVNYVLAWEDATLSGKITTAHDGKRKRFGIDEHWHADLTGSLFYSSIGNEAALKIARAIYETAYCPLLCIALISCQEVANKLLSLGVNMGVRVASKLLQDALKVPGDGRIGPLTIHALEYANPEEVLMDLREEAELFYRHLVVARPEDAPDLPGWLRRANA